MFVVGFRNCSDTFNISRLLCHRWTINGSFMSYSVCGILLVLGIVLVRVAHQSLSTIRHATSSVRFPRICTVSLLLLTLQTKADVPHRKIPAKARATSSVSPPQGKDAGHGSFITNYEPSFWNYKSMRSADVSTIRYVLACLFDLSYTYSITFS